MAEGLIKDKLEGIQIPEVIQEHTDVSENLSNYTSTMYPVVIKTKDGKPQHPFRQITCHLETTNEILEIYQLQRTQQICN